MEGQNIADADDRSPAEVERRGGEADIAPERVPFDGLVQHPSPAGPKKLLARRLAWDTTFARNSQTSPQHDQRGERAARGGISARCAGQAARLALRRGEKGSFAEESSERSAGGAGLERVDIAPGEPDGQVARLGPPTQPRQVAVVPAQLLQERSWSGDTTAKWDSLTHAATNRWWYNSELS